MNCLISKTGRIVECIGVEHIRKCRQVFKQPLSKFLNGGVRIKTNREVFAIEHSRPLTTVQQRLARRFLRQDDYFVLIHNNNTDYKFTRPFRSLSI